MKVYKTQLIYTFLVFSVNHGLNVWDALLAIKNFLPIVALIPMAIMVYFDSF